MDSKYTILKHSSYNKILLSLCMTSYLLAEVVNGHGYLADPPSRSSMWTLGYSTPANYDHMGLNCGGFSTQWNQNSGRCGICGDAWNLPSPRPNEAGGRYATGTIVRYYQSASTISVKVVLTATHKGWFEFKICPVQPRDEASQECLDKYLLEMVDGSGNRYKLPDDGRQSGTYNIQLRLPEELLCEHCLIQWKYNTGNSWGTDPDGTSCVGCGPQEQFYGCADVSIEKSKVYQSTTSRVNPTTISSSSTSSPSSTTAPEFSTSLKSSQSSTSSTTTHKPATSTDKPTTSTYKNTTTTYKPTTTANRPTTTDNRPTTTASTNSSPPPVTTSTSQQRSAQVSTTKRTPATGESIWKTCKGFGLYKEVPGMTEWCIVNCKAGFCPETHCRCGSF